MKRLSNLYDFEVNQTKNFHNLRLNLSLI